MLHINGGATWNDTVCSVFVTVTCMAAAEPNEVAEAARVAKIMACR